MRTKVLVLACGVAIRMIAAEPEWNAAANKECDRACSGERLIRDPDPESGALNRERSAAARRSR